MGTRFYVTIRNLAQRVPVSEEFIRAQLRKGELAGRKVGRRWLIPAEEVARVYGLTEEQLKTR